MTRAKQNTPTGMRHSPKTDIAMAEQYSIMIISSFGWMREKMGIGAEGTMMFAKQNDVDLRSNDVGFAQ